MQFHFIGGRWVEGNPPLITAWSHGAWMGTIVFDGARAFEGVTPDLDRHCARMVRSVEALGMRCPYSAGELVELSLEGVRRFPKQAALYIRPMAWSEDGFLAPDPETTQFVLSVVDSPLPEPNGFSACLSSFRRPSPEVAPTEAKAACHYTNSGRAEREAKGKGFDNAVMLDPIGHVAEFATANLFIAKDGVVSHAGAKPDLPQRHHPPADHRAVAAGGNRGAGAHPDLPRGAGGRRGLLHRQLRQGAADHADRAAALSARSNRRQGARALLGVRACGLEG
jgi:branched-subunit amino acid aminotransferase/4-amino-4-deoxychorismate lyase